VDVKEKRVRAITHMYYTNPKVQNALVTFSIDREVIPRYFEGFGKRPDIIQYPTDVKGSVMKGATSFHASEELWVDPLRIDSEMSIKDLNNLRKGWDLLIDVDSPFLDCSKIATRLIIEALEQNGIKHYGIKFSGSKGFHIIVSSAAFPKEFSGIATKEMFPAWPRAICGYLMDYIRRDYNKQAGEILTDFDAIKTRTKLSKEQLQEVRCKKCDMASVRGGIANFRCSVCGLTIERKNVKSVRKRLKCLHSDCAGILEIGDSKFYHYCENCKDPENENIQLNSDKHPDLFEKVIGVSAEKVANLDLVLVAPRHLFRMPYSLHEKTSLSSVVLHKYDLENFSPRDAEPFKVKVRDFMPLSKEDEARKLLAAALDWQRGRDINEKRIGDAKYKGMKNNKNFENIELKNVTNDMFPAPIKKLMKGLDEGRKRGLFVLLTFLRSINYTPGQINKMVRAWNEKNGVPLKEGYIRSQIEWHLRQNRKILPPNYSNESFYSDIGLIDKKPNTKNPLVDVMRKIHSSR
jgi:hypothetical protein